MLTVGVIFDSERPAVRHGPFVGTAAAVTTIAVAAPLPLRPLPLPPPLLLELKDLPGLHLAMPVGVVPLGQSATTIAPLLQEDDPAGPFAGLEVGHVQGGGGAAEAQVAEAPAREGLGLEREIGREGRGDVLEVVDAPAAAGDARDVAGGDGDAVLEALEGVGRVGARQPVHVLRQLVQRAGAGRLRVHKAARHDEDHRLQQVVLLVGVGPDDAAAFLVVVGGRVEQLVVVAHGAEWAAGHGGGGLNQSPGWPDTSYG